MSHWVQLGSNHTLPEGVGNKAALIHQAASAGLHVPPGMVVLDELAHLSPAERAQLPHRVASIGQNVAIRSAFSAEDGHQRAMAGFFHTELHVPAHDADAVHASLGRVWESGHAVEGPVRRDVLVMRMVDAEFAGVAFTQRDFADDLINFTSGTADKLVDGSVAGESLQIPKLGRPLDSRGFVGRLQHLLTHVRREFGEADWDIEWADDGKVCWLLQIRPITRAPRRNEAFTYANIREIMPDPPSRLMTSVVEACAPDLYAYYRGFDPTLPAERPMIEIFAGRPLFNLSLLIDTMRHWGLPSSLVTNAIGGDAGEAAPFHVGRFLGKTPVLLRQGWAQLTAVPHAQKATKEILKRCEQPGDSFSEVGETLRWLFARLVTEMFNLTAAMSGPLAILRLTGTLTEHNSRHHAISTAIFTDLDPLRMHVAQNPHLIDHLAIGETPPQDEMFQLLWKSYLHKHGRRGVYESDIARPRYHEAPENLLISLTVPSTHRGAPPPRTWIGRLTSPVWWNLRRVLSAREWWRYHSMTCYDTIRQKLLRLADQAIAAGQLPDRQSLWRLDLDEMMRLDAGWRPDADFWIARAAEIEADAQIDMPDLIHRFDDLTAPITVNGDSSGRMRGVSLTDGHLHGRAWVLHEPSMARPTEWDDEPLILIARSVDAGWIPVFSQVDGVAVEIGGDLSHGSIILREIGLPAVTNVAGLTREIQTGDRIRLDAGRGIVEVV